MKKYYLLTTLTLLFFSLPVLAVEVSNSTELQEALNEATPGTTIILNDGQYNGPFVLTQSGKKNYRIIIKAKNRRQAIINGSGDDNDAFFIEGEPEASPASVRYITINGLKIQNANRAGLRVSWADNIKIINCELANNDRWGLFTDYSSHNKVKNNLAYGSVEEHGMYFSNGGDYLNIVKNEVYNNAASGIQINADPDYIIEGFGERADGITRHALVEKNTVYNNGELGGAAINLASVRKSIFRKNLIYDNLAGGIAGWDNEYDIDYGTINNKFNHNTIYFKSGEGRWGISLKNGSVRNTVKNNILFGGRSGAYEFDDDSTTDLTMDYNILYSAAGNNVVSNEDETDYTLKQWQALGYDEHSYNYSPTEVVENAVNHNFHLISNSPAENAGANGSNIGRYVK